MTYLVQCRTFALQIIPSAISNILMVGSVFERDLHDGGDTDAAPSRFRINVHEIRVNLRYGRGPSIVSKDFVRKPDYLPTFYIRELWAAAGGGSL